MNEELIKELFNKEWKEMSDTYRIGHGGDKTRFYYWFKKGYGVRKG